MTDQLEQIENDKNLIENDRNILQKEKLTILEQLQKTQNELQTQRNLNQEYESTLKTYKTKLKKQRSLISDLKKNANELKNKHSSSTQANEELSQQIINQTNEITKLNSEITDLSKKLEKKPFFIVGPGVNVQTKRKNPKSKVVIHVYPRVYSLPGLPIIYEDEKMSNKTFKPNEPMDNVEVSSPLRILKNLRHNNPLREKLLGKKPQIE